MEQWLKDLLSKHIDEMGAFNTEAFTSDYDAEAPKQIVPKQVFNDKNEELKEARQQLESLKDADTTEDLKKQIADYESKLKDVETARLEEQKTKALKDQLTDSVDPDFLSSLLKEKVTLNEKGELEGLEETLKDYRETKPYLFKAAETAMANTPPQVDNSKLTHTKVEPLTKKDILNMGNKAERLEAIEQNKHLFN